MKSHLLNLKMEDNERGSTALKRYFLLLILVLSFLLINNRSFGQCEMKFEYEVEKTAEKSYNLKIKVTNGLPVYKIVLYNLETNKNERLLEKNVDTFSIDKIEKGRYAIRLRDSKGCREVKEIEIGVNNQ